MRTIKFRGKLCHSNQWVYGNLIIANNGNPYIIPQEVFEPDGHHLRIESDNPFWVKPETVGQFTGLQDKNGVDVYEGDIVTFTRNIGNYQVGKSAPYTTTHEIIWQADISAFVLKDVGGYIKFRRLENQYIYEVIGNIHDNPELLTKN